MSGWRFAADRGGTFTDIIGVAPDGKVHTTKVLSDAPASDPAIVGIKKILGLSPEDMLPKADIECIRLGTTVATNALLERKGGRVLLITTAGFSDLLEIAYQDRPELFNLCVKRPSPLYSRVLEIKERITSRGEVLQRLDPDILTERLKDVPPEDFDAVAVVFLHSWVNPEHERLCGRILKELGFKHVYLSHMTSNQIKVITRGQATVVEAYLSPVLKRYKEGIAREVGNIRVEFFVSSGGTVDFHVFKSRDALLSGPAGGAVAVMDTASRLGIKTVVGFDMGGTSTDVCKYDGTVERVYETRVAGVEIQTEMLNIHTIASGGGSILRFEDGRMLVGPESAGAYPGPACYGFGGPLTITDANLITGRLLPEFMPRTFGKDRNSRVDIQAARRAFNALVEQIATSTGRKMTVEDVALGFLKVANEKMALAVRQTTVARGVDVRGYTLVSYGGAAGQHACQVASLLDMERIVFHPFCSIMSAYGIAISNQHLRLSKTYFCPYTPETHDELQEVFQQLESGHRPSGDEYTLYRSIDLRIKGTDSSITVRYLSYEDTLMEFIEHYRRLYGFYRPDSPLEVTAVRSAFVMHTSFLGKGPLRVAGGSSGLAEVTGNHRIYTDNGWIEVPVYRWNTLPEGFVIKGPCVIIDEFTTLVIEDGFDAVHTEEGFIIANRRKEQRPATGKTTKGEDPVLLEVFNNHFSAIATEMGHTLKNTAQSVNIKERQDYSCAIFDSEGFLVANAPHIPVHLGSMADTVRELLKHRKGDIRPSDVFLTNNPYRGGSHLPDLTVIYPVFSEDERLIFFVAARGHHADIGGITPGSIPAESEHINQEGIIIDNLLLMRQGVFFEDRLRELLTSGPYPVRNVEQNISDIVAQIAACRKGERLLKRLLERYGIKTVEEYMGYIQRNAEMAVRNALWQLLQDREVFEGSMTERLDDGTPLCVNVRIRAGDNPPETVTAEFDFTGTGAEHRNDNLNAPLSVVKSALMYVLRCLIKKDIPLNSGCLKPVRLTVPEGTLLNPRYPVPVASGNVETSQRVVDLVLGALGVAAASQGTMNNLLFQIDGDVPYYETIGGGSGATSYCHGASAVQVHMTNTRITDPEILELRHPGIMLKRFTVRRGSGGRGRYRGGDGLIREIYFRADATVTIVSERRNVPAFGLDGGLKGLQGVNLLRTHRTIKRLPGRVSLRVKKGESIIIKTPGGGGYGAPKEG